MSNHQAQFVFKHTPTGITHEDLQRPSKYGHAGLPTSSAATLEVLV